jgi:hypothetical protein
MIIAMGIKPIIAQAPPSSGNIQKIKVTKATANPNQNSGIQAPPSNACKSISHLQFAGFHLSSWDRKQSLYRPLNHQQLVAKSSSIAAQG